MIQKFNVGDKIYCAQTVYKTEYEISFTQYCENNNISLRKVTKEILDEYTQYCITYGILKKYVKYSKHKQYTIKNILLNEYVIQSNDDKETLPEDELIINFITEKEFRKIKLQSLSDDNFNSFLKKMKK